MNVPRRYGKEKILKDIEKQGGQPTSLQEMMLALNDLKNTYANLNKKGVNELFVETPSLTDEECQRVIAIINNAVEQLTPYTIRNSRKATK